MWRRTLPVWSAKVFQGILCLDSMPVSVGGTPSVETGASRKMAFWDQMPQATYKLVSGRMKPQCRLPGCCQSNSGSARVIAVSQPSSQSSSHRKHFFFGFLFTGLQGNDHRGPQRREQCQMEPHLEIYKSSNEMCASRSNRKEGSITLSNGSHEL